VESPSTTEVGQPEKLVPLKEACEILVKHFGYTDGLWDISFEFQIAIGSFGPTPEKSLPGTMAVLSRLGLRKTETLGPHTVDASLFSIADDR